MAILYRVYQDNRENALTSGQWFARAIHTQAVNLEQMAKEIEENVSVKYSDVSAVLIELVNVMNRHLNASERVVLDGFGSFKIGLKTKGALRKEDFSASKNIVGSRIPTGSMRRRYLNVLRPIEGSGTASIQPGLEFQSSGTESAQVCSVTASETSGAFAPSIRQ